MAIFLGLELAGYAQLAAEVSYPGDDFIVEGDAVGLAIALGLCFG